MNDRRLVIITPPKCGSTTLHEVLCTPEHRGIYVLGPQLDGEIDKHTFCVPWFANEYRMVMVVRDPYERAVSLWSHYLQFGGQMTLADWAESDLLSVPFNTPIGKLLAESGLQPEIWQLAKLSEHLAFVGIHVELPVLNRGTRVQMDANTRERLDQWASLDTPLTQPLTTPE